MCIRLCERVCVCVHVNALILVQNVSIARVYFIQHRFGMTSKCQHTHTPVYCSRVCTTCKNIDFCPNDTTVHKICIWYRTWLVFYMLNSVAVAVRRCILDTETEQRDCSSEQRHIIHIITMMCTCACIKWHCNVQFIFNWIKQSYAHTHTHTRTQHSNS